MVLSREGVEGRQHPGELRLRPAGNRRGDPDQDLHLEQRLGSPELARQRLTADPSLHELARRRPAAMAIPGAEEIGQLVSGRSRGLAAGAAKQPPPQAPTLPRRDGQQVDADRRLVTAAGVEGVDRAREPRERIGVEPGRSQRLAARPGKHQLGAGDLQIVGLDRRIVTFHRRLRYGPQLYAVVGGDRRAQRSASMGGHLHAVAELPGRVGIEPQAHRARGSVEQTAYRSTRSAEPGREADDGLG